MIEVDMTQDIREYEPKLFGLVTSRQILLLAAGCCYSIPLAVFLPLGDDITVRFMVGMLCMIPVILLGWVEVYGMRLEQFLWQALLSLVLTPHNRIYKTDYAYEYLREKEPKKKQKIIRSSDYLGRR